MSVDEDYEDYEEGEDESTSQTVGTPPDNEKQNIVEELYNCEKRVVKLMKSWSGNYKQDAIAGRRFLNKQYSALIGVINTTNAFTRKGGDDCKAILYRSVKAFILDLVNERTIHRKHYYTLVFTYWHTLELFLGLPLNGHGARVLKDALAGLNTPDEEEPQKETIMDYLRRNKKV